MILVSACLVGENCKYSGGNNRNTAVLAFLEGKAYVPFCPEQAGGLSTPRPPCEKRGGEVYSAEGEDVTDKFRMGAQAALAVCRELAVTAALLKEASPSCGTHRIYDGTFTGTTVPGMGVAAELLQKNGVCVLSEEDIEGKPYKEASVRNAHRTSPP